MANFVNYRHRTIFGIQTDSCRVIVQLRHTLNGVMDGTFIKPIIYLNCVVAEYKEQLKTVVFFGFHCNHRGTSISQPMVEVDIEVSEDCIVGIERV